MRERLARSHEPDPGGRRRAGGSQAKSHVFLCQFQGATVGRRND